MLPFHYLNCSLQGIWGMVWGQDSVGEADGWTLWSWSLLQPQWFYDSFWRSTCCITGRTGMYLHLSSSFEEWLRYFFGSHICSHFSFNLPHSHVTVLKEKAYKHRFAMFWVGFFFFFFSRIFYSHLWQGKKRAQRSTTEMLNIFLLKHCFWNKTSFLKLSVQGPLSATSRVEKKRWAERCWEPQFLLMLLWSQEK